MKIKTVQQMRFSRFISIVMIALVCSCNKNDLNGAGEKPSLGDQCVVSLGAITMQPHDSFDSSTKSISDNNFGYSPYAYYGTTPSMLSGDTRTTQTTLEEGANFRLYAFPRGETEMEKMLNTKSFTITNGLATLDPDQDADNLYLPYGELDIYIVGPAKITDRDVASKDGVFALQGDDVIASKTEVKITRTSSNIITPNPLSHRMAKIQVRVRRPKDATYKELSLTSATILTQEEKSPLYTFDEYGGSFAPTGEGESKIMLMVSTVTEGTDYIATGILFPRKADRFKIEVVFGATNNVGDNTTYSRQSTQIENIALPAGEQTAFVAEPIIPNSLLYRPVLIPWNATDEMVQSTSPLALYLDGRDAPEMINGKNSWRDRSGNGRHATMNSDVPYNPTLQCYEFAKGKSMNILLNEYMANYTLEIVAISEPQIDYPIIFRRQDPVYGNTRAMSVHLPYKRDATSGMPATIFDSGFSDDGNQPSGIARVSYGISDNLGFYKKFHTYHFVKSISEKKMEIYCDGELITTSTAGSALADHGKFTQGTLGDYNAKIRSIRLYNKALSSDVIKVNYQTDLNINKEPEADQKVATNGLIFYFDGMLPPYVDPADSKTYWPDRSKELNHAKVVNIIGDISTITHNGSGYEFNNVSQTRFSGMDLSKSAGTHQAFTFELVCRGIRKTRRSILFAAGGEIKSPRISMRILEEQDGRPKILYDVPYIDNTSKSNRYWVENQYTTWEYFGERFRTWTFIRTATNGEVRVYVDGKLIFKDKVNGISDCPEMINGRIGALDVQGDVNDQAFFSGEFKAIRAYKRVLTEAEMATNRAFDAKRYGVKFSE